MLILCTQALNLILHANQKYYLFHFNTICLSDIELCRTLFNHFVSIVPTQGDN